MKEAKSWMSVVFVLVLGMSPIVSAAVVATHWYECNKTPAEAGMVEWVGPTSTVADSIWTLDSGSDPSTRGGWYWMTSPYDGRRGQPTSDFTCDVRFRIVSQTNPGRFFSVYHGVGEAIDIYANTEVLIGQEGFSAYNGVGPVSMPLGSDWHTLRVSRNSNQGPYTWSYSLEVQIDNSGIYYPNGWGWAGYNMEGCFVDDSFDCSGVVQIDYIRYAVGTYMATDPISDPILPYTPEPGTIVVDGEINDWLPEYIFTDGATDGPGEAQMTRWGAYVHEGTLYGFVEMSKDISTYATGTNDLWAGLWIDADDSGSDLVGETSPYNSASSLLHNSGQIVNWINHIHQGVDINMEIGLNTSHWGEGFNFWGAGDDVSARGSAVAAGQIAYAGKVLEFSCPVSEITAELARYPDNVTPAARWKVGMRVEASLNEGGPWGGDVSDTIEIIPKPLPGDANLDNQVTFEDFSILQNNYGQSNKTFERGDFNGDLQVSFEDFSILQNHYGQTGGSAGANPLAATAAASGCGPVGILMISILVLAFFVPTWRKE